LSTIAFQSLLESKPRCKRVRLARACQIVFEIANNFVCACFELTDEAPGGVSPEDLRDKDEAEHDAIGVRARFLQRDWALKPGPEFVEAPGVSKKTSVPRPVAG